MLIGTFDYLDGLMCVIRKLLGNSVIDAKTVFSVVCVYASQNNTLFTNKPCLCSQEKLSLSFLLTVCRPGFFKASPHSQSCSKCPPHSYTHEEASTSCVCEKDYFRRESDPPTMACTSKEPRGYLVMLPFTSLEKGHDAACCALLILPSKTGMFPLHSSGLSPHCKFLSNTLKNKCPLMTDSQKHPFPSLQFQHLRH